MYFDELRNELDVMRRVDHPNIIKLYDVFETSTELYIVMELCQGGELFDRIKSQENGAYSEKDASSILRQILEGLKYLHERRFVLLSDWFGLVLSLMYIYLVLQHHAL